jgi:hypothetical protein
MGDDHDQAGEMRAARRRLMSSLAGDQDPLKRVASELYTYCYGWDGVPPWTRLALARAALSLEGDLADAMRETSADADFRAWVAVCVGELADLSRKATAFYACLAPPLAGDERVPLGGAVAVPGGPPPPIAEPARSL